MRRQRLKFVKTIAAEPMSEEDYRVAEELLAKFIARAYRADHPELFRRKTSPGSAGGARQVKPETV